MRVERIDLQNIRRFEKFEARFQPGFNVIIGENGSGKTTLLTLLKRVLSAWSPAPEPLVTAADKRERIETSGGVPTRLTERPWMFYVAGTEFHGIPFSALDGDAEDLRTSLARLAPPRTKRYHMEAAGNLSLPLPLLAYFSPWREPPRSRKPRIRPSGVPRRLDGYDDALDLHADFKSFAAWFKGFEMQRLTDATPVPAVEAVRSTVISCIPGCTDLRWFPVLDDIVVTIDGVNHLIWQLSDGFRTMLALVGELAWRAAVLNPGLGAEVAKAVEGVVLIDEIDLHLHPRWQRRVVSDLQVAFPRVQFIATTHSPFVVQSMRAEEVINLNDHAPMDYWKEGIEDIAAQGMGVTDGGPALHSRRYRELEAAALEYYRLLEAPETDPAELSRRKLRLDGIELEFLRDPALAALLKMRRIAVEERR